MGSPPTGSLDAEAAQGLEGSPPDARLSRWRINLASFLIDASTYSFSTAVICHAESKLGASYWQLGKLGALGAFCYSLTCFLTGGLSDRLGSGPLIFTSVTLLSVGFVATRYAAGYEHLLLASAYMGASLALFWPALMRKLSRLSPGRTLWSALGVFNMVWAMGVGTATLSTPWIYAHGSLGPTLDLGLLITLATVPLLAWPMPEPPKENGNGAYPEEAVSPERARLFLRLGWIANFTAFFAMVGIMRVFPRVSSD